jgi:aldose 1-epimerase
MGLELFGTLPTGESVWRCTLKNKRGMSAELLSLGGIIQSLRVPDKTGKIANIVLGRPDLAGYQARGAMSGAVIGRVANRIRGHQFQLNGKVYTLPANNGNNTLHGGTGNYGRRNFSVIEGDDTHFRIALHDNDETGFPGDVDVTVCYSLDEEGLLIHYQAVPTQDTPFNITNHVYFNLAGQGVGKVYDQELQLEADFYTVADAENVPTGEIRPVAGTPLDFTQFRKIGPGIEGLAASGDIQGGFDHNLVLKGTGMRKVAVARDAQSGRVMETFTDMPGVQLFTANHTAEGTEGNEGTTYGPHCAFCLETQFFPDAVNLSHFPSSIIKAGTVFSSCTAYRFPILK